MDFNLDDPLGDILSDGSNDSFFESAKKQTKSVEPVKSETPVTENKSKMADLFGIKKDESKSSNTGQKSMETNSFKDNFDILPISKEQPKPIPETKRLDQSPIPKARTTITTQSKKEIAFDEDNNDIDLGFDLKKIKSKSGILNELLGVETKTIGSAKKKITIPSVKTTSSPVRVATAGTSSISKTNSRQSAVENFPNDSSFFGDYAPTVTRRSGRRGSSTVLNDPLGLFSTNDQPKKTEEKKTKIQTDWLGLDQGSKVQEQTKSDMVIEKQTDVKTQEKQSSESHLQFIDTPKLSLSNFTIDRQNVDLNQTTQIMNLTNRETENSMNELKQQEMQIMFATQIKNQEQALWEIQKRQELLIKQQETQFNNLLQKQLQRQQQLEENIKSQQDRINSHIQFLLSQPVSSHNTLHQNKHPEETHLENHEKSNNSLGLEIHSEMKRLEYEKNRLENLIANININHDQEIDLLEHSYKKQIGLLNENLINTENRLKDESKCLEEYFQKKINVLQLDLENQTKQHDAKLGQIVENYEKTIRKLKEQHEIEVEEIRNETRNMVENIRQSKLLEFSVMQENGSYLQTLKNASKYLENATGDIQSLRDTLHEKLDVEYEEKKIQLELKENHLNEQEKRINVIRESAESEKSRLLELVKNLEIRLSNLSQSTTEEEWILKQKITQLDIERSGFEREREFYRDQQKREEKNIEELKKLQNQEYDKKLHEIEEEKLQILNERTKLETLSRVQAKQPSKTEIEIEAAIKIAEDAARQADLERTRFLEMQRKFEIKKRELIDKENILRDKEHTLELSLDDIKSRERNTENALRSVKISEKKVKAKIQILQKHSSELTMKEATLAKEKLELTQERTDLHTLRRKLYSTRCSLCKLGEKSQELSEILSKNEIHATIDDTDNTPMKFNLEKFDVDHLDKILDREVEASLKNGHDMSSFEINIDNIPNIMEHDNMFIDQQDLMQQIDAYKNKFFNN